MNTTIHTENLRPDLKLQIDRTVDRDNPGVYIFALLDKDDTETEVGTVLIELYEGKIIAKIWDEENQENDPVSIELCTIKSD